jgi:DNA polymerase III delta prime subunit
MSKSYIVNSSSAQFIQDEIDKLIDVLEINDITADYLLVLPKDKKQSIGIDTTRKLKEWFKVKPYSSPNKLAVIRNSELLTTEAQNSILKLLEEPNDNCFIILSVENQSSLLPTILSRCELIQDLSPQTVDSKSSFTKISRTEQFQLIDKLLAEKDAVLQNNQIKSFLKELLHTFSRELKSDYFNTKLKENIALVEQTSIMISGNASKRLALENLIINMKY